MVQQDAHGNASAAYLRRKQILAQAELRGRELGVIDGPMTAESAAFAALAEVEGVGMTDSQDTQDVVVEEGADGELDGGYDGELGNGKDLEQSGNAP